MASAGGSRRALRAPKAAPTLRTLLLEGWLHPRSPQAPRHPLPQAAPTHLADVLGGQPQRFREPVLVEIPRGRNQKVHQQHAQPHCVLLHGSGHPRGETPGGGGGVGPSWSSTPSPTVFCCTAAGTPGKRHPRVCGGPSTSPSWGGQHACLAHAAAWGARTPRLSPRRAGRQAGRQEAAVLPIPVKKKLLPAQASRRARRGRPVRRGGRRRVPNRPAPPRPARRPPLAAAPSRPWPWLLLSSPLPSAGWLPWAGTPRCKRRAPAVARGACSPPRPPAASSRR